MALRCSWVLAAQRFFLCIPVLLEQTFIQVQEQQKHALGPAVRGGGDGYWREQRAGGLRSGPVANPPHAELLPAGFSRISDKWSTLGAPIIAIDLNSEIEC